jgi:tRNA threonylcarbamoyladenosine biosynthesis protein TsaE
MENERLIKVKTSSDMHLLGRAIGSALFPNAFIAFYGGLGAGKTTMTKGIAAALCIEGILSPTFTIVRHHEGRLPLDHFDAYRIEDESELYAVGYEDYLSDGGVIVMEWCENVPEAVPMERLEIRILGSGEEPRLVRITAYGDKFEKLLKEVFPC